MNNEIVDPLYELKKCDGKPIIEFQGPKTASLLFETGAFLPEF